MMRRRFYYGGTCTLLLAAFGCAEVVGIGDGGAGGESSGVGGEGGEGPDAPPITSPGGESAGGAATAVGGETSAGGEPASAPLVQVTSNKLDLLLAIDNSISMAEKQQLLAEGIPDLVKRLVNPPCLDGARQIAVQPSTPEEPCPAGSEREIAPLRDVHIGVISSSLGSHGANAQNQDVCTDAASDDHAHLIPRVRPGVDSYEGLGFLKWDPDGNAMPPGESDVDDFAASLQDMLASVGETGCGFEAQLESVYRFLVDPEPHVLVTVPQGSSIATKQGLDASLLGQRDAFLRPDSSVVVLMLSDENDCSVVDEGYGWLLSRQNTPMFRATSACAADPNAPCCQSCGEQAANEGCGLPQDDAACTGGITFSPESEEDPLNLRCFEQKRRFGFDLLYPLSRYVNGFNGSKVPDRDGELVANPLFVRGGTTRDRSLFSFAFVGGVPWQDIATSASLNGGPLEYLSANELVANDRWPVIVGDLAKAIPPKDPFMRESRTPRQGTNPIIDASITQASSTDPRGNPINGHEHAGGSEDLQFACTFELPASVDCDEQRFQGGNGCGCFEADLGINSPACNPPGGGPASITQYYGKAYPGLRQLDVARRLGARSVLGSVCAPNVADPAEPDYGYRPVLRSLSERLTGTLIKP